MRTRLSTLILLAMYIATWPTSAATAACDTQPELESALQAADSVFVAQVTAISEGGATAEASVKAIWKGADLPSTVTLWGGDSADTTSGTTRIHQIGQTYLVVASWSRTAFVDDKCTATRLYQGLATEIPRRLQDAVGADEARLVAPVAAPADGAQGDTSNQVLVVLGVLIILGLLLAVMAERLATFKSRRHAVVDPSPQPDKPTRREKPAKQRKRLLAGWASGRFSRSGSKQVDHLKKR